MKSYIRDAHFDRPSNGSWTFECRLVTTGQQNVDEITRLIDLFIAGKPVDMTITSPYVDDARAPEDGYDRLTLDVKRLTEERDAARATADHRADDLRIMHERADALGWGS